MDWIRQNIEKSPSFGAYFNHVEVIEVNVLSNPSLCIDTCKTLVEGICKTILTNQGIEFSKTISFQGLVQQTINSILFQDEEFGTDISDLGRRIASVSQKVGEIRNNSGFASHGLDVLNPKLTSTISELVYRSCDVIGGFILNCYLNNRTTIKDSRLHYEDCLPFNTYFDDLNPVQFGFVSISASEALFKQDYEAYRETYFEWIESIDNELEPDVNNDN